jgi:DNA-binding FadR family transcriptional regulator
LALFNLVKSEATMNQISLTDRAYLDLREKILLREYLPGHRLTSREIANEFNCSTVTIGRVLQTLASEGYLEGGARASGTVRHWTERELRDAIDMRAVILTFAAYCCAKRTNQLALARLKALSDVLETLAASDRRLDVISDCIALFETELCMGTSIEGLPVALRKAFPPALIRKSVLVADEISLDQRFHNLKSLVALIAKGQISQGEAAAYLEFDGIDAALLEKEKCPVELDLTNESQKVVPFRGKETTYSQWASDSKRLPTTATP